MILGKHSLVYCLTMTLTIRHDVASMVVCIHPLSLKEVMCCPVVKLSSICVHYGAFITCEAVPVHTYTFINQIRDRNTVFDAILVGLNGRA